MASHLVEGQQHAPKNLRCGVLFALLCEVDRGLAQNVSSPLLC